MVRRLAISVLLLLALACSASTHAWPPLPVQLINGGAQPGAPIVPVAWSAWNEQSALTLKTDQSGDGVDDINICFYQSGLAADETPRGISTSAYTQTGTVAAATGSPPSRALDGTNDGFLVPTTTLNTILPGAASWIVVVCISDVTGAANEDFFFKFRDEAGDNWVDIERVDGKLQSYIKRDGLVRFDDESTGAAFPTSGKLYVVAACNGSKLLVGFTTTKPTKASDFAAANRIFVNVSCTWPATLDFGGNGSRGFFYSSNAGSGYLPGSAFYTIIGNYSFIDLDT